MNTASYVTCARDYASHNIFSCVRVVRPNPNIQFISWSECLLVFLDYTAMIFFCSMHSECDRRTAALNFSRSFWRVFFFACNIALIKMLIRKSISKNYNNFIHNYRYSFWAGVCNKVIYPLIFVHI